VKIGCRRDLQIKSPAPPVKYAPTTCESGAYAFDACACGDYVMGS
jgi:hypothetical protein